LVVNHYSLIRVSPEFRVSDTRQIVYIGTTATQPPAPREHNKTLIVPYLKDIMRQDNDEENMEQIKTLIDEIKREKQMMRDEAHIIRGELSQAMYNEDLRSHVLNFIDEFEEVWQETPKYVFRFSSSCIVRDCDCCSGGFCFPRRRRGCVASAGRGF
uniref:V-type proton ATPase subunit a n=1 Tax=Heligmosomoides polygyrus TaxID=6339 RepID=A0A183GLE7_HELPZ